MTTKATKSTTKRARKTAAPAKAKRAATKATPKKSAAPAVTTGAVIEKTYKGKALRVEVTSDGYIFEGTAYKSLTALALKITGYKAISGPAFFGTAKKATAEQAGA